MRDLEGERLEEGKPFSRESVEPIPDWLMFHIWWETNGALFLCLMVIVAIGYHGGGGGGDLKGVTDTQYLNEYA